MCVQSKKRNLEYMNDKYARYSLEKEKMDNFGNTERVGNE